jgi:hypothetical protein
VGIAGSERDAKHRRKEPRTARMHRQTVWRRCYLIINKGNCFSTKAQENASDLKNGFKN